MGKICKQLNPPAKCCGSQRENPKGTHRASLNCQLRGPPPCPVSLAYISSSLCTCETSHQTNVRQGKHLFRKMLHGATSPECLAGNESLVRTPAAGGQEMEPFAQYIFSFQELVLVEMRQLFS